MPTAMSLLLDLYECQSPALDSPALLEELFRGALQFAGLETIDHMTRLLPNRGYVQIFWMEQSHAVMYVWAPLKTVSIDIFATGKPEQTRPALELFRGYATQKLLARSAKAKVHERGE